MVNPGLTIAAVLLFAVSLVLLIWGVFSVLPTVNRRVARSFWCPFCERNVTVDFEEEAWDGARLGVSRCTAFTPPEAVTCEKLCLRLDRLPVSKRERAA